MRVILSIVISFLFVVSLTSWASANNHDIGPAVPSSTHILFSHVEHRNATTASKVVRSPHLHLHLYDGRVRSQR